MSVIGSLYAHHLHFSSKVSKDVSQAESKEITFDDDGSLVFDGETYAPEREVIQVVKRGKPGNPYAVRWDAHIVLYE